MDIGRLYEYITLAECLNYSKAAQQLYITQPVLSRHIHDLEVHVGAQLLVRDTHSVELTPIGKLFYDEAVVIVGDYENALKKVADTAHGTIGYLKIGFMSAAVEPFLRDFVLKFRKEQPSIQLDFEAMDLDELLRALNSNRVDIGFATHVSGDVAKPFHVHQVLTDGLCLAVSTENELSKRDSLSIEEISNIPVVCLSKNEHPATHRFTENLFANHGSVLNVTRYVPNIDTALFFTSLNMGAFIIPAHLTHMVSPKNMKVIPISDADSSIKLNIIWRKDNMNPVTPIFCDAFESFGKSHGDGEFH